MQPEPIPVPVPKPESCSQCQTSLPEGMDREVTQGGIYCRPCFNNLTSEFDQLVRDQSIDIPYAKALIGGLLGGMVGSLAWWGVTAFTSIAFGLVAVVIGIAVGKGVTLMAGDKRSRGLQVMSAVIAGTSFFYATYLVNRTLVMRSAAAEGGEAILPLLPDPGLFVDVVALNFGVFEILFLGFVLWEAWKMPAPVQAQS